MAKSIRQSIKNVISSIFKRQNENAGLVVKFYRDANEFGEHGRLIVSHMKYNLVHENIAFVFVGLTTPPKLNLELMTFLHDEADKCGFKLHHVETYGVANTISTEPIMHRNYRKNALELKASSAPEFLFDKNVTRLRRAI